MARLETAARQVYALRRANLRDLDNAQKRPTHAQRLMVGIEGRQRAIVRLMRRHGADRVDNEVFRLFGEDGRDGEQAH